MLQKPMGYLQDVVSISAKEYTETIDTYKSYKHTGQRRSGFSPRHSFRRKRVLPGLEDSISNVAPTPRADLLSALSEDDSLVDSL